MDHDNQGPETKKEGPVHQEPPAQGPGRALAAGEQARLMEEARRIVEETPEVRPEKVAALKEALEKGTYRIDARKLANILLAEWLGGRKL